MKTKIKNKKNFDSIELMQRRRIEIGKDIANMNFNEEKAYLKESANKLRKFKLIGKGE